MKRNELVDRCKAIIKEAYEEATEMVVAYIEMHPKEKLQLLCKEIDAENWKALESRVCRLRDKRAREASKGAKAEISSTESDKAAVRHARRVLRKSSPEQIAELLSERDVRVNVSKAQDLIAKKRETAAKEKEREVLGDETVDNLDYRQALEYLEGLLHSAHGNAEGFVRRVRIDGTDIDGAPENWKRGSLELVAEIEADLGMVKLLLEGATITDDDINELLAGREV